MKFQNISLEEKGAASLTINRPPVNIIITSSALAYSPDELQLYLVDFKEGVEMGPCAEAQLPHAVAIAIESEREFGLSVLYTLNDELEIRGKLFRDNGVKTIDEYRGKTQDRMPRVLLLVDEFQIFFNEDDHISRDAAIILDRLVRQGHAFGMHVLLGSQTIAGSYTLTRSTIDQMAVRIALQCGDAAPRMITLQLVCSHEQGKLSTTQLMGWLKPTTYFRSLSLPKKTVIRP